MAWVTKDSVEQYKTPESKKEYTKQEKAANWWHYHKLHVGIAVIAVVLVVWMVHDVVTRVRPDYRVGYVGSSNLPTDTVTALENTLAAYCDDRNGDGKVVVELVQYNLDFDSESENTDAYTQMAGVTGFRRIYPVRMGLTSLSCRIPITRSSLRKPPALCSTWTAPCPTRRMWMKMIM